jgi:hypothetical protein
VRASRKYLAAVALLAVLAVIFGLAGTVAPLPEPISSQQELSSSSDSVTHFINPPTFDSEWVDITDKLGQSLTLTHNLNTTEVLVDVAGRQSLTDQDHKLFFGSTTYVPEWNKTYGGTEGDVALSVVQTSDGGYATAGCTDSYGVGGFDFWLVKTDSSGNMQWNKTYGGAQDDFARALVQSGDGGYAMAGDTNSFYGAGLGNFWLVKTGVEYGLSMGLSMAEFTNSTITLYRGRMDPFWNFVRVRIWVVKEPTWQFGDINQDGVVDAQDLYIVSKNYGKTFSALSLTGIIAIAGIYTHRKRKQQK